LRRPPLLSTSAVPSSSLVPFQAPTRKGLFVKRAPPHTLPVLACLPIRWHPLLGSFGRPLFHYVLARVASFSSGFFKETPSPLPPPPVRCPLPSFFIAFVEVPYDFTSLLPVPFQDGSFHCVLRLSLPLSSLCRSRGVTPPSLSHSPTCPLNRTPFRTRVQCGPSAECPSPPFFPSSLIAN